VVDTVAQCKLQRGIRLSLCDLTERCSAEQGSCAHLSRVSEWHRRDHEASLDQPRRHGYDVIDGHDAAVHSARHPGGTEYQVDWMAF
jgi:hypothetical protein